MVCLNYATEIEVRVGYWKSRKGMLTLLESIHRHGLVLAEMQELP
jgi:hypothetical protein